MRTKFREYLKTTGETPVNPEVCEGISYLRSPQLVPELEHIYREVAKEFPPYIKFIGIEMIDPVEYARSIMNRNMIVNEEILWSDVFLVNIVFSYIHKDGREERIENPVYMPYINRGGIFTHGDVKYVITPVLTDRVISIKPNENQIFIKLLADKIPLHFRTPVPIIINGNQELIHVLDICHRAKVGTGIKTRLTPALYLLGKYGFKETISRYYGIKVNVIEATEDNLSKIDHKSYWVWSAANHEFPHDVKIAFVIERDSLSKKKHRNISRTFASIFYTLGSLYIEYKSKDIDDPLFWRTIMSIIVRGTEANPMRSFAVIMERYSRMDCYLDVESRRHLKYRGVKNVNDFYDLLQYIDTHASELLSGNGGNMWSKYPEVGYYILYNLITKINNAKNTIVKQDADAGPDERIGFKKVANLLRVTARTIFRTISGSKRVLAVSDVGYTGDNMVIGTSTLSELQDRGDGVFRKTDKTGEKLSPDSKRISAYAITVGNMSGILKRLPTPLATINPFVLIDKETGSFTTYPWVHEAGKTIDYYLNNPVKKK